jgi:endonuclease/exonuclease/phosphatase family metal-dependent hydrolase
LAGIYHLNVFCRPSMLWKDGQVERARLLPAAIVASWDKQSMDVVVLHEVFDAACQKIFEEEFKARGYLHVIKEIPGVFVGSGTMIFSRVPISNVRHTRYNKSSGVERLASKGVICCRLHFPGSTRCVVLAATHMSAWQGDRQAQRAQLNSFVCDYCKCLEQKKTIVVIVGDLNAAPPELESWMRQTNLYAPPRDEKSEQYTYPCEGLQGRDNSGDGKRRDIDHTLFRTDFYVPIWASSGVVRLLSPYPLLMPRILFSIAGIPCYTWCLEDKCWDLSDHCAVHVLFPL